MNETGSANNPPVRVLFWSKLTNMLGLGAARQEVGESTISRMNRDELRRERRESRVCGGGEAMARHGHPPSLLLSQALGRPTRSMHRQSKSVGGHVCGGCVTCQQSGNQAWRQGDGRRREGGEASLPLIAGGSMEEDENDACGSCRPLTPFPLLMHNHTGTTTTSTSLARWRTRWFGNALR